MVRKPPAGWQGDEGQAVKTARAAARVGAGGLKVARTGGHLARGLFCYFFAAIWGLAAIMGGLFGGSLPTFFGVGAMAAFMAWAGAKAFAKAQAISH